MYSANHLGQGIEYRKLCQNFSKEIPQDKWSEGSSPVILLL